MADPRRIVPDTSVLVAAYFGGPGHERAKRVLSAISRRSVVTFAPDTLVMEFVKVACRLSSGREARPEIDPDLARELIQNFLALEPDVQFVDWRVLAPRVVHLAQRHGLPAPDAWFIACAAEYDAELWFLDHQRDRVVEHTRHAHRRVHVLSEEQFRIE